MVQIRGVQGGGAEAYFKYAAQPDDAANEEAGLFLRPRVTNYFGGYMFTTTSAATCLLQTTKPFTSTDISLSKEDFIFFKRLIEIDSPSENVQGVNQVQVMLARQLSKMGFSVELTPNPDPEVASGRLLVAEFPGASGEFISLVGHADTVLSNVYHDGGLQIEGTRAFGSGVIDDKGGLMVALLAIREVLQRQEKPLKHGLRFVCSPNEEVGSPGFSEKFKQLSNDSFVVLGFEPACGGDGDVVVSRKGNRWYDIHVYGKKAHAGRDFSKGINACGELAAKLLQMQKLTDLSRGMSVNIGKMAGGTKHNVVSDYAFGQIDLRFSCFETREFLIGKMSEIINRPVHDNQLRNQGNTVHSEYKIVDDCPPLESNDLSCELFSKFNQLVESVENRSVRALKAGGASDCNYFSQEGKPILDGLGPIGGGMHTENEFIELNSIETRSQSVARLINFINQV